MQDLTAKSFTELRGIAQAMGLELDWGWDKLTLIGKINAKLRPVVDAGPTESDEPDPDYRLRVVPPAKNLPQKKIAEELDKFRERGLVYEFPTDDTVRMTVTIVKEDCINLRTPLRNVIAAARRLVNP